MHRFGGLIDLGTQSLVCHWFCWEIFRKSFTLSRLSYLKCKKGNGKGTAVELLYVFNKKKNNAFLICSLDTVVYWVKVVK